MNTTVNWENYHRLTEQAYESKAYQVAINVCRLALLEAICFEISDRRLAQTIERLADLLNLVGEQAEAAELYLRVLELKIQYQGEEIIPVGCTQNKLAGVYFSLKQFARAESLLTSAINIYARHLGASHSVVKILQENLSRVRGAQRTFRSQVKLFSLDSKTNLPVIRPQNRPTSTRLKALIAS